MLPCNQARIEACHHGNGCREEKNFQFSVHPHDTNGKAAHEEANLQS